MSTNTNSPTHSLRLLAGPTLGLKPTSSGASGRPPSRRQVAASRRSRVDGRRLREAVARPARLDPGGAVVCPAARGPIYLIRIGRIVLVFRIDGEDPPWGDLLASIQRHARSPEEVEAVRCVPERAYPAGSPESARLERLLPQPYRRLRAGLEDQVLNGLRIHRLLSDSPVARSPAAAVETARGILARAMPFLSAAVSYL